MTRRQKKEKKTRSLANKFIVVALFTVLVWVGLAAGRATYRKYEINKEVEALKQEAERLENRNSELAKLIELFNSEDFLEKEIREKLNLKKEGEKVIVIQPEFEPSATTARDFVEDMFKSNEDENNFGKWWDYFFRDK